jgi:hypothetical protein
MARRRYQIGCLFIRGKRRKVWVARWREYEFDLERYLLPVFGPMSPCDITRAEVQTFLASKRQQDYAGSTVHSMRSTLSKVLQSAVEWDYLDENPAQCLHTRDFGVPEAGRGKGGQNSVPKCSQIGVPFGT